MCCNVCSVQGPVVQLSGDDDPWGDYQAAFLKDSLPALPGLALSSKQSGFSFCITVPITVPERQRSFPGVWRRGPASYSLCPEPQMQASPTGLARPPPNLLLVVSPNQLNDCAGCYILQANAHANGQPLWKHIGRSFWLFSTPMPTARWAIAGNDAKDEGFVRPCGWIYQEELHEGLMPDQSGSRWMLFDGKNSFTADEAFKLAAPIRDKEAGFIMQAPDEGLPKSRKQASCSPRSVIVALVRILMRGDRRRESA